MTAIPHAAGPLTSALGRFERASSRLLEAANAGDAEDAGVALVEMTEAKTQAQAGVAVIRFADAMWDALLEIQRTPKV